jgi:hypothetical protein
VLPIILKKKHQKERRDRMKRITARTLAILCTVCSVLLLHCLPANAWVRPGVSTDKDLYYPGEPIRVRFSGAPGYNRDWICIAPSGSPDTEAGQYQYMPRGLHRGHLTFTAPAPGHYQVRAYYNYRRNGYLVSARNAFTVEGQRSSRGTKYQGDYIETQDSSIPDPKLRQAQYVLIERGYDPGDADGLYGRKTKAALRLFQKDNQLRQSGKLNMVTLKALGLLKESDQLPAQKNVPLEEPKVP